jgi:hypothetical protein
LNLNKKVIGILLIATLAASCFVLFPTSASIQGIQVQTIGTMNSAGGHECHIIIDSNDYPHVIYSAIINDGLKHAFFNGKNWVTQVICLGGITGSDGAYCSIQLDSNGNPQVSYAEFDSTFHSRLKYAWWNGACWNSQTIDNIGGLFNSIALDSRGYPHISYYGNGLSYAYWNGSKWTVQIIDSRSSKYPSLQIDTSGNPHMSYYNTTSNSLEYATWTETGWKIETLEYGATFSSLVLDSGDNPHLCYTCDEGLKYAVWNGTAWNTQIVDTTGDPIASVGASCSLALDSKGNPHISYIDQYRGTILKYAFLNGSSWMIYGLTDQAHGGCSTSLAIDSHDNVHIIHGDYTSKIFQYLFFNPANLPPPPPILDPPPKIPPEQFTTPASAIGTPKIVDSYGTVGTYTSIALDKLGDPHIAYQDQSFGLKYAYCNGSTWQVKFADSIGFGYSGFHNSIALDKNGQPHISYSNLYPIDVGLKYICWNGLTWNRESVYSSTASFPSLSLDDKEYPHISYWDAAGDGDLKYAYFDGLSWHIQTADSSRLVGEFTSLALDAEGNPHISYYDILNQDLRYASWDGSSWHVQTVDSGGDVGFCTSLKLDNNGSAHISYLDNTNGLLKYAESTNSGWHIQVVDDLGISRVSLSRIIAYNQTSLALDSKGFPHISYFGPNKGNLKYAFWDGSTWVVQTADSTYNVGWCSSLALDSNDRAHISYYDGGKGDLRYIESNTSAGFTLPTPASTPTPSPTSTPKPADTFNLLPAPTPKPIPKPTNTPISQIKAGGQEENLTQNLSGSQNNLFGLDWVQIGILVFMGIVVAVVVVVAFRALGKRRSTK